jgi:hypothetical protein
MALLRTATTVANYTSGTKLSNKTASTRTELVFGAGVEGAVVSTPVVTTAASADALASYLANTTDATSPLVTITLDNDSDARLAVIRDIELNQRVTATESVTGATLDGFVEQITHKITNAGLRHTCEVKVSARTRMVGIYSPGTNPAGATVYALSAYTAASPTEPPPYATYGF